jgi:hypothetical protein
VNDNSEPDQLSNNISVSKRNRKIARLFAFVLVLSYLILIPFYSFFHKVTIGPPQPIPFSHRVHVHKKELSCLVCHTSVTFSDKAGIPPIETCLLCHTRIISYLPPIIDLRDHFYNKKPIIWKKVTSLPDYAYFSHRVHIQEKIDCGKCHGNTAMMDRVEQVHQFSMGFCLDCHRTMNAPIDCYTCHR